MWKTPELEDIQTTLRDPTSLIGMRMRAAYYAKQLFVDLQKEEEEEKSHDNTSNNNKNEGKGLLSRTQKMEDIVTVLCEQVFVKEHGSLLRHEFAYVLGQMKTERACTTLENLLLKEDDCVMVRHEAAEALGTLDELSDTCLLALNRLNHVTSENDNSLVVGCACMLAPYNSIDPVEVDPAHISLSTTQLGDILINSIQEDDTSVNDDYDNSSKNNSIGYQRRGDLIERYRAMFCGGESWWRGIVDDTSSPLLRHEVAFVLGQLQHPCSISALEESLSRLDEHAMVRHESAEALGAIEGSSEDWERIESILTKYQKDFDPAVAESCIVALDAADYWGSNDNNASIEFEECSESESAGVSFGKQKHASTVATSEIRKHILAQHFNVVQTAA
ncbi:ARM repeat-containing protein [Fragilariopsis cylindrus CCMP1102]|uniref:ARM repeat-containing protein n=1 Tax=Fragilariopsis cylindrus CCMP1102 TaxID=635003 RepID=A0A1E7F762_9STRA|nr:ARM repeat-containing protein [Fragilariopsis cylindrus CCMP1102]|eukprot:OEU14028.1 ARM repeat-containing protein [Fragilariopsis cylindrus CCMP1102]